MPPLCSHFYFRSYIVVIVWRIHTARLLHFVRNDTVGCHCILSLRSACYSQCLSLRATVRWRGNLLWQSPLPTRLLHFVRNDMVDCHDATFLLSVFGTPKTDREKRFCDLLRPHNRRFFISLSFLLRRTSRRQSTNHHTYEDLLCHVRAYRPHRTN